MDKVIRLFVEKKPEYALGEKTLLEDLRQNIPLPSLTRVRHFIRYDMQGMTKDDYLLARSQVFSEPPVDICHEGELDFGADAPAEVFAIEYLRGQYDQRADSAMQCVQLLTHKERPLILVADVYALYGKITRAQLTAVKNYLINPVESCEASLELPDSLELAAEPAPDVPILAGFNALSDDGLEALRADMGLAMSAADLAFCREYFALAGREPSVAEIRVIDTYWSDHCRHTTFLSELTDVQIEPGEFSALFKAAYKGYLDARDYVYKTGEKPVTLMDIATIAAKELSRKGLLPRLDASDEINACSIRVTVNVDGKPQDYAVMFKNETHNHPTEIEPFGGAATCLGGAIRDPLSGRSYVYQAMRISGCADPRVPISETLPNKLPQRKLTTKAAEGFSSYGNQIGLATGLVNEVYHDGFLAKRMELGAVIGAAPFENILREVPTPGDVILLLGGRTGRDGCGGATGSSKEHTEDSLHTCGAEVQKGNALTERKIQRLFRNPHFTRRVKRCNDFGAGGVCVAIGELTPGLLINLDKVPKKYEGLSGTELAISESQERMALVVAAKDADDAIRLAAEENLECTPVAVVTDSNRLQMDWRGTRIIDISRAFLDTNGAKQFATATLTQPDKTANPFTPAAPKDIPAEWEKHMGKLNICSQRGLVERFDSTVGANTVLLPYGGAHQATPAQVMAALVPALEGESSTATLMAYGYDPDIALWSPFHGACYALISALAKLVAAGADYSDCYLSLQEYFERMTGPESWGKPLGALLGALHVQRALGVAAIGGKDSMSGTFKDINVPPTLVAFAVSTAEAQSVVSNEFKAAGSRVGLIRIIPGDNALPDMAKVKAAFEKAHALIASGRVLSASALTSGGLAEGLAKACFGNRLGFAFGAAPTDLFTPSYGSIMLEFTGDVPYGVTPVGRTAENFEITYPGGSVSLNTLLSAWEAPLEKVFATTAVAPTKADGKLTSARASKAPKKLTCAPRVVLPVFPGTNCEYETARVFERAGAQPDIIVIKNLTPQDIDASIRQLASAIDNAHIVAIPGGFSGGDEPDGSGKFIAATFRNPLVGDALMRLLKNRDGLMLGICNGFQALVKLGLVPYGEIRELTDTSPTLTFNTLGRHVCRIARTRITSTRSPWLANVQAGDVHLMPVSHGEGRFVATPAELDALFEAGQVATQFVDMQGNPTMDTPHNPSGSMRAIEGIMSPDGRVLGKMGHNERAGARLLKNLPGNYDQGLFAAGVAYFL